jgi:Domain of unknown function (DUF5668)
MNTEAPQVVTAEKDWKTRPQRTSGMLWGLFLVAIGGLFLYQRMTGYEIARIWDLWPIVFLVIGTNQLLDRRPGSAITWYGFAFVFLGVEFDWFEMSYVNSWPLFLIAIGLGIVVKTLTGEERARKGDSGCQAL